MIAHGNKWFRVVSVIPVERLAEFVDEPAGGVLEVEAAYPTVCRHSN